EDGIRDRNVTGVQTCALPISRRLPHAPRVRRRPRRGVLAARRGSRLRGAARSRWRHPLDGTGDTRRGRGWAAAGGRAAPRLDARSEERRVGKAGGEQGGGEDG